MCLFPFISPFLPISQGKFIQTVQYGGHRYGLTRDAVEDVARDGLACCVHMELEVCLETHRTDDDDDDKMMSDGQITRLVNREQGSVAHRQRVFT